MDGQSRVVSFILASMVLLLAIVLYDVMAAIVKLLSEHYSAQQLTMYRNLFGLAPSLLILFTSRKWVESGRPILIGQWKLAVARGSLGVFAQMSFYLSLLYLPLATAATLVFAGPLFVTALSVPVLGHRIGLWRWSAVVIGFLGVLLVLHPTADSFNWYTVLPVCAAFGFAGTAVTATLFDKTVPTALINLYYTSAALIGSTVLAISTDGLAPVERMDHWAWLACMGIVGGLAAYCMTTAFRLADPSSLSPFQYFGIPSSFVLGWLFFSEAPFGQLFPGVLLIVGGGLLIVWRERSLTKPSQPIGRPSA